MKQNGKNAVMAGILSVFSLSQCLGGITPVIAKIGEAFPDIPSTTIMYVSTVASLAGINFVAERGKYDVTITATPMGDFIYQLAGPRSLEIVENSIKKDIHDLEFMRSCEAEIAGHKVRVTRMGMGCTLSYEVHGPQSASEDVYNTIAEVGKPYGMRRAGSF